MHEIHHASNEVRKGVITLCGIERWLWRRAAETKWQRTEQKDWQNKPGEKIGHELDLEARRAKSRGDTAGIVSAKMPRVNIFL